MRWDGWWLNYSNLEQYALQVGVVVNRSSEEPPEPAIPTRTTLSYAVLGLLSLRPMNAYELVQGYGRSLGQVMSRSEAAIYAEPRRLEADGLVTHTEQARGRRTVPVYDITDAGRAELHTWLGSPPTFPQVDAEPALRVLFADQGDVAQLRATVVAFREEAITRALGLKAITEEYVGRTGPYQDRFPVVLISGRFVSDLFTTYVRWCDWALEAIDAWEQDTAGDGDWASPRFAEIAGSLGSLTRGGLPGT